MGWVGGGVVAAKICGVEKGGGVKRRG